MPSASVMVGDSWERDVWVVWAPACRPSGSPRGRPVPEHRDRVAVVDSVLQLEDALGVG